MDSRIGEHPFHRVAVAERVDHRTDCRAIIGILGTTQANGSESLLHLAARERVAVAELLTQRLRAIAGTRQGRVPPEELVLTYTPVVFPVVISRLEVMVTMANSNLSLVSIRQQISSAIDVIVQTARLSDGARKIMTITEVGGMEGEVVTLQDLFVFEKGGISMEGRVQGRFSATGIRPKFYEKIQAMGLRLPAELFESVQEIR
jgi:hypothetical protein